jgi:hypothetical protein
MRGTVFDLEDTVQAQIYIIYIVERHNGRYYIYYDILIGQNCSGVDHKSNRDTRKTVSGKLYLDRHVSYICIKLYIRLTFGRIESESCILQSAC